MVNYQDHHRRWHLLRVSYMGFYSILSSGLLMIASMLSTCTHIDTHTESIYWFICLYTPISCMLLTLGRNHGTDVAASNKWLKLSLTLQEETSCWRPSWSALLKFLILCLWDIFISKKIVFNSDRKNYLPLLQLATHTYETAINIFPTFFSLSFVFTSWRRSALYDCFTVFPGRSIPRLCCSFTYQQEYLS